MSTIGNVTPALAYADVTWASLPAAPAALLPPGGATSRDAQIADLGSTSSDLNSLLALAQSSASPSAPISMPQNQHQSPPSVPATGRILSDAQLSDDDS